MNELTAAAVQMAQDAGEIVRRYYADGASISFKAVTDLVTDADRAAEDSILSAIDARFSDHAVLAEESGEHRATGPYRWVVDPIDGTTNFAHRLPHFSVLIAVQRRHDEGHYETVSAVTLEPLRRELFVAERGGGTTLNGEPVRVSSAGRLIHAVCATGFGAGRFAGGPDNHAEFCRVNLVTRGLRRLGSAGLDLAYVACGRMDGFWEYGLNPWDITAGVLLVEEAGGRVTTLEGDDLVPGAGTILATNGRLHEPLQRAVLSAREQPVNSREGLASHLPEDLHKLV